VKTVNQEKTRDRVSALALTLTLAFVPEMIVFSNPINAGF